MDLIFIFRTSHPNAEEYTVFSSAHGTFSRIDHMLGHKSNLSKFEKIEIISSIFSDHNAMRLDINYKKKAVRNTNTWRLNNMFLNNQQVIEKIRRKNQKKKKSRNKWQWKHNSKPMGCCKNSPKKEFIAIQSYLKKQEKLRRDNVTLHLKQLEKVELKKKSKLEGKKS